MPLTLSCKALWSVCKVVVIFFEKRREIFGTLVSKRCTARENRPAVVRPVTLRQQAWVEVQPTVLAGERNGKRCECDC